MTLHFEQETVSTNGSGQGIRVALEEGFTLEWVSLQLAASQGPCRVGVAYQEGPNATHLAGGWIRGYANLPILPGFAWEKVDMVIGHNAYIVGRARNDTGSDVLFTTIWVTSRRKGRI